MKKIVLASVVALSILVGHTDASAEEISVSEAAVEFTEGYNVDDLRDILGMDRHMSAKYANNIARIADEYRVYKSDDEMQTFLKKLKLSKIPTTGYDEAVANFKEAEKYIADAMGNGLNAEVIFGAINNAEFLYKKTQEYYTTNIEEVIEGIGGYEEAADMVNKYLEELEEVPFVVGELGDGLEPYTNKEFMLSRVYGTMTVNGETEINDCIASFNSYSSDVNILSQFNGIVGAIETDDNTIYSVEIMSGSYVKVKYTGLKDIKVKEGDIVKQYDIIGVLESGTESELYIEVDGRYINPLLLFGTNGKQAFYEWLIIHTNVVVDTHDIDNIKRKPSNEEEERQEIEDGVIVGVLDDSTGEVSTNKYGNWFGFIEN